MRSIRHGLLVVGLLLIVGCGTKVVKESETDAKAIVPEYVVDAKELLGLPLKESEAKVSATTDFRSYMGSNISYAYPAREYGRTTPYFTEATFSSIETYTLNDKAYLALSGYKVGRVELTHSGVVSAEEAVMMLGYDPKQLIEHPIKHRNAERSDWFAVIGSYFHIIEIQWFDAEKLGRPGEKMGTVTQIRVSVW
ncbi:hypothetical protein C6502_20695 [Candidatus Poribacteria bacterium]|nr:MAG: hypothetical protein C6502_20695 [Candidatus Poribacteria bacterium]